MSKPKSEPMDAKIKEVLNPKPAANNRRVCWTLKTLVAEFAELFPETPVEYSNYDGRNTALDVTFDLTVLDEADRATVIAMFSLFDSDSDSRIAAVITDGHWPEGVDGAVLIGIQPGPRTQDSREPFGLGDAYMVLIEAEEGMDANSPGWRLDDSWGTEGSS